MTAGIGAVTMALAFVGLALVYAMIDRWAARLKGEPASFRGDVGAAFSLGGSFRGARLAVSRALGPFLVGGWLMVILDPGGQSGGSSRASDAPPTDWGFLTSWDPFVLAGVAVAITVVGLAFFALVTLLRAWLTTGWIRLQHATLVEASREGTFSTLFGGGDRTGAMFAWLLTKLGVMLVTCLPLGIGAAVVFGLAQGEPQIAGLTVLGVAMFVTIGFAVWIGSGLALGDYLVVLDDAPPLVALRASLNQTRGQRMAIVGFAIVWGLVQALIAISGVLALCVGVIFTIPLARALHDAAWCRAYLRARDGVGPEVEWREPHPATA